MSNQSQVVETEFEVEQEEGSNGWRNLYLFIGGTRRGEYLWKNKEQAEEAAKARSSPEESEYLGAFPEPA